MKWIYLSPHFDDAVYSCGGLIWDQHSRKQQVEIWTICASRPPSDAPLSPFAQSLHARWQTGSEAVAARQAEDQAAIAQVAARARYYSLPDCIYRRLPDGSFLVNGEEDLWQTVHPQEASVLADLRAWIEQELAADDCLVCPMSLGNHVDHRLVRAAAESLGCSLYYYPDFPYVMQYPQALPAMLQPAWYKVCTPISDEGVTAWQNGIAAYRSQVSTFWNGLETMKKTILDYWQTGGGSCLWRAE